MLAAAVRALFSVGARIEPTGWLRVFIRIYGAGVAAWTIYAAAFAYIDRLTLVAIFVCAIFVLVFLNINCQYVLDHVRLIPSSWRRMVAC